MSLVQLFKTAFVQPKDLLQAKEKAFGKVFLYMLFLSLILCVPIGIQLVKIVNTMQEDIQAISKKLPDFTVKNHQLMTAEKDTGFIYQTDYLIFSFDPDNKREATDIKQDLVANVLGIGLLKDKVVFAVTDENLLAAFLPATQLELSYKSFDSSVISKEWLNTTTRSTVGSWRVMIIAFLILFLPLTFDFMLTLIMISLFANIFTRIRQSPLKYTESLKIVVFAATVPVTLSAIMNTITPTFNSNFLVMFLTLFTYVRAIAPTLPKNNLK